MIDFLKYYYFRMYSYFSGSSSIPVFRTFAIMFIFTYFNVLSLFTLIVSVVSNIKFTLPEGTGMMWFWPLLFVVPLFALFYYRLKYCGLHDLIIEEYSGQTKKQRLSGGWRIVVYFIASVLFFVLSLWLRQIIRGY